MVGGNLQGRKEETSALDFLNTLVLILVYVLQHQIHSSLFWSHFLAKCAPSNHWLCKSF